MTIAESDPVLAPVVRIREPAPPEGPDASSVLDTTELRWFFAGPLPSNVRNWYVGSSGVAEERCDAYLLDGRVDIGVKRRFGTTLELKVRQSLGEPIELGEGLVDEGTDGRWVDVHKSVVKRRFLIDGTEVAFSSDPLATGACCDVEIAEVTVGAVQAWTFAFAAFGPPATRRNALLASWQTLAPGAPRPGSFGPRTGQAMGYPQWLALTVSPEILQNVAAAAI